MLIPTIGSADSSGSGGLNAFPTDPNYNLDNQEKTESREEIVSETKAECAANPESCGITLSSFLDNTGFAETEPNDYILSADPLTLNTKYWGQLYSAEDQDWYYITTTAPNQILSADFSVPGLTDITGWNISIRDSGGNIFSEVNSGFDRAADTLLQTALSHTGTYYIVVKALSQGGQLSHLSYDYNIAAFLESSQLTNGPIDVNFFDTEVEPNDSKAQANPLSSNVTMLGLLSNSLTFGSTGFAFEDDWFVYESEGNETLSIEFCTRQDCEENDWQITLLDENGTILAHGQISKQKKYYLGIRTPGHYYLQISTVPNTEAKPVWQQYNFTVTSTKLPPLMSEAKGP